ncbi:MAG: AAA family ATPase [Myxococcota bacterium]
MTLASVELRVLGPLAVLRDGEALRLPQSKKTRGLLAYLAITSRAHRRDRLCSLLWDVADDPRGALRWSLSKIRPLVDSNAAKRLVADRENVELKLTDTALDWHVARRELRAGLDTIPDDRLEALAASFQGELLEGLDLMDFDEFTAWCAAEREHARTSHTEVLWALIKRYEEDPPKALPHARELVRIDPLNQDARARLIRMLAAEGRRNEARTQYESATRLLEELGSRRAGPLVAAWHDVQHGLEAKAEAQAEPEPREPREALPSAGVSAAEAHRQDILVGREEERSRLIDVLERAKSEARLQVFLLKGESGVGKTTLLAQVSRAAREQGCTILEGAAYEAESSRPYGPWIDALRRLPATAIGKPHRTTLARLLPELGEANDQDQSRDRLFGAVVDTVARCATAEAPALVMLDDIHWCDDASAELLHYVARMTRERPVAMILGARDGELVDNESTMRLLRSLRREGLIDEHLLLPLTAGDVRDLVAKMGSCVDADQVFAQSGGNALLAHELAQASSGADEIVPKSLKELIGDRVDRLPAATGDLLRWAAVLGPSFDVTRLTELVSLDFDQLMNALSLLERHALLDSEGGSADGYQFHHGLVHQVVYSEISEPRRRLMHLRVAKLLEGRPDPDGEIGIEIAHHAGVGGDAALAAEACVVAGNRCLRMFANAEALSHARRGLRFAEALRKPRALQLKIELAQIATAAHTPEDVAAEAARIEALAEEALDAGLSQHARLGFTVVSYLRWQVGAAGDAHRLSLRAEFASRGADDGDRIAGMAEAARCLVKLDRDVPQAEALLLEARALNDRAGRETWAVSDGLGLLRLYGGELSEARTAFENAWTTAKRDGDRLNEFMSLEHLVTVAMHQDDVDGALRYADAIKTIGDKLREGSERPMGRATRALCRYWAGDKSQQRELDEALVQLRDSDAKQRLATVQIDAALIDSARGEHDRARSRAEEALRLSEILDHGTNIARAQWALLRIARETGDEVAERKYASALGSIESIATYVRDAVEQELQAQPNERPHERGVEP